MVTPLARYTTMMFWCTAIVTDPDETPITEYVWTIGGNVVGVSSVLSTTAAMPDDAAICTVTAIDSDMATDTNSGSQVVVNRNPMSLPILCKWYQSKWGIDLYWYSDRSRWAIQPYPMNGLGTTSLEVQIH